MFEQAIRLKLRFETAKGALTVEDLYDLPLTSANRPNLNDIAKGLSRYLRENEEDFVGTASKADTAAQLKFSIVKHVIAVRLAENEAAKAAADRRETKNRIMELIAKKQDESLQSKSLEELQAMVATL